jgi:hypothetical protein
MSLTLTVTHAKTPHVITMLATETVLALKEALQERTSVPVVMIRLMKGGLLKDETKLQDIEGLEKGRIIMVGTKVEKILEVESAKVIRSSKKIKRRVSRKENVESNAKGGHCPSISA